VLADPGFATRSFSEVLDLLGLAMADHRCKREAGNAPLAHPLAGVGTPRLARGDKLHHKVAVIDDRSVITGSFNWSPSAVLTQSRRRIAGPMFELRPYQADLIQRCTSALKAKQSPLVVLPTGGGKTALIAEMVRLSRVTGRRVVVICHRREIAHQIAAAIARHTGHQPELATAGSKPDWNAPVMVAMVPTLVRRLTQLPQGGVLLADEAHHMGAASWQKVKEALAPELLVGFTATPIRPNGCGLGGVGFDVLLEGPSPRWLMDNGFLCDYTQCVSRRPIDMRGVRIKRGDYDTAQLAERVLHIAGDVVRDWERLNVDRLPTLCVGVTVAHAQDMAAAFRLAGITAAAVDGSMSTSERDRIFAAFCGGAITVLCACAVVDEGLDVPEAGCLQLVRPTKSLRLLRQLQGRVLRPSPGKDRALLIDHGPSWKELPPPCEQIRWSLDATERAEPAGRPSVQKVQPGGRVEITVEQRPEVELGKITPEEAATDREFYQRQQLHRALWLASNGKIPRTAIYSVLSRAPRSRGDFAAAARVLGRSPWWAQQQFIEQKIMGIEPPREVHQLIRRAA
jgi:superfamily II DNA or RNA helicase